MKVLIVEDENTIRERLERLVKKYFSNNAAHIKSLDTLDDADEFIHSNTLDLLILDLNLYGRDGFSLLKNVLSQSFHTIVVSAYQDRAVEAFEYGVLDFVAKPFTATRLEKALDRFKDSNSANKLKYLCIRKHNTVETLALDDVEYFKADNVYSEVHIGDGSCLLHDKSLAKLEQLLPNHFKRIHKSFIANLSKIKSISRDGNSTEICFDSEQRVPVSRSKAKELNELLI